MNLRTYLRIKQADMGKLPWSEEFNDRYKDENLIRGAMMQGYSPEDINNALPYMKGDPSTVYGYDREEYPWEKKYIGTDADKLDDVSMRASEAGLMPYNAWELDPTPDNLKDTVKDWYHMYGQSYIGDEDMRNDGKDVHALYEAGHTGKPYRYGIDSNLTLTDLLNRTQRMNRERDMFYKAQEAKYVRQMLPLLEHIGK